jgi:hypothetical protein
MNLTLLRTQLDQDVTIGQLTVDGKHECWVCEDTVREVPGVPVGDWKVPRMTAIPYGTYDVQVTFSNRFQTELPLLVNVPGFEGIRIHPGNGPQDTEGCLLPGELRMEKGVGKSRIAFNALFAKIKAAKARGEKVTILVTREQRKAAR